MENDTVEKGFIGFSLPLAQKKALYHQAIDENMGLSAFMRRLVTEFLEAQQDTLVDLVGEEAADGLSPAEKVKQLEKELAEREAAEEMRAESREWEIGEGNEDWGEP